MTVKRRRLSAAAACIFGATGLALACSRSSESTSLAAAAPPVTAVSPFVVSNPHAGVGAAATAAGASASASDVVYVALPPGSIPNAEVVTIRVRPGGAGVTATAVDGGLDPVPVPAEAGDTLDVEVRLTGTTTLVRFTLIVPKSVRPTVVRTSPPTKKRDIPLNMSILVVFSEPIAAPTLNGSSVQLVKGTTRVPGQLAFADPAHLTATFTPDSLFAPATDYTLTVTQAVQDLDGQSLETPVTVEFTTGTAAPPPAATFDGNWSGTTSDGRTIVFTVQGTSVLDVSIGFRLTGDCGIGGITYRVTGAVASRFSGQQFTVGDTTSAFTFTGTFLSATTVSGSASANYTATFANGVPCRSTGASTWTAQRP
jgi:hypothetical protein